MSGYDYPQVSDFKAYFTRDFPYGSTDTTVMDSDISKGLAQEQVMINQELFGSQSQFTIAALYLAAHYMVTDLQASSQGVAGKFTFLEAAKSVGNVNAQYSIPQRILDQVEFAMLARTVYGAKYLEMIVPLLAGPFGSVRGRTHA